MKDKKTIDRLFQERFKDFEAVPHAKIWNNIEAQLHPKKKTKVIPFWWKLSGIAASFVVAFLAYNTFWKTNTSETVIVLEEQNNSEKNTNRPEVKSTVKNAVVSNTSMESNEEKDTPLEPISNKVVNSNTSEARNVANKKTSNSDSQKIANKRFAELKKKSSNNPKDSFSATNAIVENTDKQQNTSGFNNNNNSKKMAFAETYHNQQYKNSNLNKFEKQNDSLLTDGTATNPLEEIVNSKKQNKKAIAVTKLNRWQVSTNVAPVFFNSTTNGSPIESQFAQNSKSYENNMSVGVGVQYAVNKKLALRTGVNKMTLGYNTNDVLFFGALNSSGISNLSNSSSQIQVLSASNTSGIAPFEDNLQNAQEGVLNQKMGYYEVPLEVSYALIDKKWGLDVIGGFSTLFLNENSVSVQSATTNMSLGRAKNLNDVHFSSNFGLGVKYKISQNFQAHFEPTLKYQFNTFRRDAGNFKPYFVGLYTGVSYKF